VKNKQIDVQLLLYSQCGIHIYNYKAKVEREFLNTKVCEEKKVVLRRRLKVLILSDEKK
jgi:hypothetical protein